MYSFIIRTAIFFIDSLSHALSKQQEETKNFKDW